LARIKNHLDLKVQRDTLKRLSEELSIEVSELLSTEQKSTHLATHDSLTGVPNRTLYFDRLTTSLSATRRTENFVAVLLIDLDGFKAVNESLGDYMGDELLKSVAIKLNACVRETDTVARLGGDEFVVLLTNLKDPKFAEKVADNIIKALSVPFNLGGMAAPIGARIGIACSGGKGEDVDGLMRRADGAMYDAKRGGKNKFVIAPLA